MTTKDEVRSTVEALKLALEALEWLTAAEPGDEPPISAAITAIREALAEQPAPVDPCIDGSCSCCWSHLDEQPSQQTEPCGWRMKHNGEWAYSFTEDAWDFIRRVPKAQQQEPVAWVVEDNDGERLEWAGDVHSVGGLPTFPLYTSPPASKPWAGLSDESVWSLYKNLWMFHPAEEPRLAGDILKFARAIEAKLKEKNGF